jgi:hypothetical protein
MTEAWKDPKFFSWRIRVAGTVKKSAGRTLPFEAPLSEFSIHELRKHAGNPAVTITADGSAFEPPALTDETIDQYENDRRTAKYGLKRESDPK